MNREIKFRAWNGNYKQMKEVFGTDLKGKRVFLDINLMSWWMFNHCKLMQYTELKDKNGKEVYEGDIVQDSNGKRYVIKWGINSNGYIAQTSAVHCNVYSSYHLVPKTEVVGNIYENPELI